MGATLHVKLSIGAPSYMAPRPLVHRHAGMQAQVGLTQNLTSKLLNPDQLDQLQVNPFGNLPLMMDMGASWHGHGPSSAL